MSETLPRCAGLDPAEGSDPPARLPLERLNSLWFQVTGLLCNFECTHCLVDSSPSNRSMAFLSRDSILGHLRDAESLGVKEIYFTGGEPFLHREMVEILDDALSVAPTTVLTNGALITERTARELGEIAARSRYSLEIRVSMDHPEAGPNDSVRGSGAHAKALRAILRLQDVGLLPIVTVTEYALDHVARTNGDSIHDAFRRMLIEAGVHRPRLKILPVFHTGKLEDPHHGGPITASMLRSIDPHLLQCAGTRAITAEGVYACPILVGKRAALQGTGSLSAGLGPVTLSHHACRTCFETGMTCGNS